MDWQLLQQLHGTSAWFGERRQWSPPDSSVVPTMYPAEGIRAKGGLVVARKRVDLSS